MIDLELMKRAVEASNDGLLITTGLEDDCKIIYANPAFAKLTGYSIDEIQGQNCRFLQNNDCDQANMAELHDAIYSGHECRVRIRNYRKNGEMFWNDLNIAPVFDKHQNVTHFIGIQKDVSVMVSFEEQIAHLARHDYLTNLLNRRGFNEDAQQLYATCKRLQQPLGVAIIDIDYFKQLNDEHGHSIGDVCLKIFAQELMSTFREGDIIGRIGGDEFVLCIPATSLSEDWFEEKLADIITATKKQLNDNYPFNATGAIVIVTPNDSDNLENLIHLADKRMYAKRLSARKPEMA